MGEQPAEVGKLVFKRVIKDSIGAWMPVVLRHDGFRFLFYANEGSPREPVHIHALRDGIDAKFWIWPEVKPAYNDGFNAKVLRELTEVVEEHRGRISEAWDEFFGRG